MEWVSSKCLMDAMGARLRPCSTAAQRVCKRAHAGLLRARAKRFFADGDRSDDVEVPAVFWWAEGLQALTQDWEAGDFETWLNHKVRLRAFGVEWAKDDAEDMGVSFLQPLKAEDVSDERTGDPGRPSLGYQLYKSEFDRRWGRGEMEHDLKAEARALLQWFEETHPDRQAPTAKTIANRIRDQHRERKGDIA